MDTKPESLDHCYAINKTPFNTYQVIIILSEHTTKKEAVEAMQKARAEETSRLLKQECEGKE